MIYFDNAATTFPKPRAVASAMMKFMAEAAANPGRSGHKLSLKAAGEVYKCRTAAAELFHAPGPECVAFTLNATQAVNFALKGFLKSGMHVITSDLEHNAVMRPLYKMATNGLYFSAAKVDLEDDNVTLQNFERQITKETTMIVCTHASNVCGRMLPIEKIGELCHECGLKFLVDASQTAGIIPINMEKAHIDYLCMPGHKSLYGPMGTGILIAKNGESLETIMEGGTGSNSVNLAQPDIMPDRFESGTVNAVGITGLYEGIRYVKDRQDQIYKDEKKLLLELYDKLSETPLIQLYTPRPLHGYMPVLGFNIGTLSSEETVLKLDKMGFALRGGLHCSPAAHNRFNTLDRGMARASIGCFNNIAQVRMLVAAVRKIARQEDEKSKIH